MSATSDDTELLRLVESWEETGESPEALCQDRPELLEKLKEAIANREAGRKEHPAVDASDPTRTAANSFDPTNEPPEEVALPSNIGVYRILGLLGRGGMGAVYRAEQPNPKRIVALKVISASFVSAQLLRRFDLEAQTLGRLKHPGIAQVYEAGLADTPTGQQPFFAMELVEGGVPLDEYAAQQQLTVRQRLDLLARVCDAVQYAHQQSVIHRDLKPDNILVTSDGQPKILDFGVARVTDSDIQATTMQTDVGQIIGTLPYMSPEQAGGNPDEVDTRSDVYALGVITYELLAGRLPYDLSKRALAEAVCIIREDEPTRLSSISRTLRGDVETIVGKALAKEKDRRYASVNALAADIRRYLSDEPIAARPPSTWYQLHKFTRRNKALVGGIAATFVVLVAGVTVSMSLYIRAEGQRKGAEKERQEAQRQAAIAEATNNFLAEMLGSADPGKLLGEKVTVLQATEAAVKELDRGKLKDQPLLEAAIRTTVGKTFTALGAHQLAEPNLRSALQIRRQVLPPDHPSVADSCENLAWTINRSPRRLPEAAPLFRESLQIRLRVLPPGHRDIATALIHEAVTSYLLAPRSSGQQEKAESQLRVAVEMRRNALPAGHPEIAQGLASLASMLQWQKRFSEAEPLYREALDVLKQNLPAQHPDIAACLNDIGTMLEYQRKYREAEQFYSDALQINRASMPQGHDAIRANLMNLRNVIRTTRDFSEAEPFLRELREIHRNERPPNGLNFALTTQDLAIAIMKKNPTEAEGLFRDSLNTLQGKLGSGDHRTRRSAALLVMFLQQNERPAEAEAVRKEFSLPDASTQSRTSLPTTIPRTQPAATQPGTALSTKPASRQSTATVNGGSLHGRSSRDVRRPRPDGTRDAAGSGVKAIVGTWKGRGQLVFSTSDNPHADRESCRDLRPKGSA